VSTVFDPDLAKESSIAVMKERTMSEAFWSLVSFLKDYLEIVFSAIRRVESDSPRFSRILYEFMTIRRHILDYHYPESVRATPFVANVSAAFRRRFATVASPDVIVAHYLDVSAVSAKAPIDRVLADIAQVYDPHALGYLQRVASRILRGDSERVCRAVSQWTQFQAKRGPFSKDVLWSREVIKDAMSWWTGALKGQGVDELVRVAVQLLSLPATSASVERSFKVFRNVFAFPQRARLGVEKAEKLVRVAYDEMKDGLSPSRGAQSSERTSEGGPDLTVDEATDSDEDSVTSAVECTPEDEGEGIGEELDEEEIELETEVPHDL
jgi:hypothetical protein